MARKFSPHSTLKQRAETAEAAWDEMNAQRIVFAMIAHFRGGHVSLEIAAKRCHMTPDNFRRAMTIADNEARQMLIGYTADTEPPKEYPPLEVVQPAAEHPPPPPEP